MEDTKIKARILPFQVVQQQVRMDDDTILHTVFFFKQRTEGIAFPVCKVLFPEQRIAEGEPGRYAIFLHQCKHPVRLCIAKASAAPAPDAVGRCTVDRTDLAPVVKIFPVFTEQRQKHTVQFIKFKQSRKMIICRAAFVLCHCRVCSSFL